MSRDAFLKGALILTAAGVLVKVIGSVNRILLSRLLGGEGIGLYQMAYPIYLLALSVSSAGIPVAISILVAEKIAKGDYRGANRIFRVSLYLLVLTGAMFTGLLYFGAGWLVERHFVRDPRAFYAIAALAPAIFFVTVLSSYRGYFQGLQRMTPTAVSQIAEQLVRVATMIGFSWLLLPQGLEYAAAGASFGAAPGAAIGLLVLILCYWRYKPVLCYQMAQQPMLQQDSGGRIVGRIIRLALPVSLANIMLPIVSNIDLLIVPARLEAAGYTVEQATEQFGYLTGMATPLAHLPVILTTSLAASLVPAISEAYTLNDKAAICRRTAAAIRISNWIAVPSAVGMYLLATPISQMLYGTPNAGTSIALLSISAFLLGIQQVSTSVLQGMGSTTIPVVNMGIAAGVKVFLAWVLTAMPALGIKGAAWASLADFGLAGLLNVCFVYGFMDLRAAGRDLLKTMAASAAMGAVVLVVYDQVMLRTFQNTWATLAAIAVGGGLYALLQLAIGGVKIRDIERIPRCGPLLARQLERFQWIRR